MHDLKLPWNQLMNTCTVTFFGNHFDDFFAFYVKLIQPTHFDGIYTSALADFKKLFHIVHLLSRNKITWNQISLTKNILALIWRKIGHLLSKMHYILILLVAVGRLQDYRHFIYWFDAKSNINISFSAFDFDWNIIIQINRRRNIAFIEWKIHHFDVKIVIFSVK